MIQNIAEFICFRIDSAVFFFILSSSHILVIFFSNKIT
nr:MAG TPA: hypothetical protein [Caudoviricetes sp.]